MNQMKIKTFIIFINSGTIAPKTQNPHRAKLVKAAPLVNTPLLLQLKRIGQKTSMI